MPAVLEPLRGRIRQVQPAVQLFSGRKLAVEFVGQYVVLPINAGRALTQSSPFDQQGLLQALFVITQPAGAVGRQSGTAAPWAG